MPAAARLYQSRTTSPASILTPGKPAAGEEELRFSLLADQQTSSLAAAPILLARCLTAASQRLNRLATAGLTSHAATAATASQGRSTLHGSQSTHTAVETARQPQLSIAAITRQGYAPGYKKHNQDACLVMQPYLQDGQALLGVADGHGIEGHLVADYIKDKLPKVLYSKLKLGYKVHAALTHTFEEVDDMMTTAGIDVNNSGSTLLVSLLQGQQLTTAWVGDSRAVVGRQAHDGRWTAHALSQDHKPDMDTERRRITNLGGRVQPSKDRHGQDVGPARVWRPDMDYPGLAMSRALGDATVKHLGVISTPDITTYKVKHDDQFVVLATDGVWEYLSNEQVVHLVGTALASGPTDESIAASGHLPGTRKRPLASTTVWPSAQSAAQSMHTASATVQQEAGNMASGENSTTAQQRGLSSVTGNLQLALPGLRAPPKWKRALLSSVADPAEDDTEQGTEREGKGPAMRACAALVDAAHASWVQRHRGQYIDDISAVVIALHHHD